jgi:GTP cyclohydrolase I
MTRNDHGGRGLAPAEPRAHDAHVRSIDRAAVQRAACDLLRAVGADVEADALKDTPRRVADAYAELLTPQPFRATTFPNDDA